MFESIRDKLFSPQPDQSSKTLEDKNGCNLNAGAALLEKYQNEWMISHNLCAASAKHSEEADKAIGQLMDFCNKQWDMVTHLMAQLSTLPAVSEDLKNVMKKIGILENGFQDLEKSLLQLENLVEVQHLQEKQLDERFDLAMYKEKKLSGLETLKYQLAEKHAGKVHQFEAQQKILLQERQEAFKEVFEEEMKHYKTHGHIERVASVQSSEGSLKLEDVELDQDDALDAFLAVEATEDLVITPDEGIQMHFRC